MLIDFRVGNFRSFNEPQTLSLVAGPDEQLSGNLVTRPGLVLLKAAVLYGANASGKSNLLTALRFAADFVATSATQMTVGDAINVVPFRLSSESRLQPSLFEMTLV